MADNKVIAGGIGAVLLVVATLIALSWDGPAIQHYDDETRKVVTITGKDLVFWTSADQAFHLCEDAAAAGLEPKDDTVFSGTVAEAHAAGKDGLTPRIEQEKRECGFDTPAP